MQNFEVSIEQFVNVLTQQQTSFNAHEIVRNLVESLDLGTNN